MTDETAREHRPYCLECESAVGNSEGINCPDCGAELTVREVEV